MTPNGFIAPTIALTLFCKASWSLWARPRADLGSGGGGGGGGRAYICVNHQKCDLNDSSYARCMDCPMNGRGGVFRSPRPSGGAPGPAIVGGQMAQQRRNVWQRAVKGQPWPPLKPVPQAGISPPLPLPLPCPRLLESGRAGGTSHGGPPPHRGAALSVLLPPLHRPPLYSGTPPCGLSSARELPALVSEVERLRACSLQREAPPPWSHLSYDFLGPGSRLLAVRCAAHYGLRMCWLQLVQAEAQEEAWRQPGTCPGGGVEGETESVSTML